MSQQLPVDSGQSQRKMIVSSARCSMFFLLAAAFYDSYCINHAKYVGNSD